jgi:methylenetetrahydrofolate dehydrogenase (NADP+)/methenyltetrahydrofolate cyclohydrolase
MKLLDGREVRDFIKARQVREVHALGDVRLAIVRQGSTPATDMYLRVKQRYGNDIGVSVDLYTETASTILDRIRTLNADPLVTAINVELPFADAPKLEADALALVALSKDVEGLAPDSTFEIVTPKAILWLLAAYNVELKNRSVAIVGLGRLVGAPLRDRLIAAGISPRCYDVTTEDLKTHLLDADMVITATGHQGLITSAMLRDGAVVVDAGAPASDLAADVLGRLDLTRTPNPGGVGPMTVAALYDNILIAARLA